MRRKSREDYWPGPGGDKGVSDETKGYLIR